MCILAFSVGYSEHCRYKSGLKAQGCGKLKKAVFTMELDPDEEDETEAE